MTLMPMIGKARVLRSWGGIMDMTPDGSPIIDKTHIDGLFVDCGWCYGGFKAVPGSGYSFAHLLATGQHHAPAAKFRLDRFRDGGVAMQRPAPDAGVDAWDSYVHLRDNPAGETRDLWHHEAGCGAWVLVTRDTVTHKISDVVLAREAAR